MVRRMSAQEACAKFADLLGVVHYGKEAVVIEKQGRTFAVVISPEDYEKMLKERQERFRVFDELRARNPGVTSEQAIEDALREIAAVRRERRRAKKEVAKGSA